jgi:hypothetical protein
VTPNHMTPSLMVPTVTGVDCTMWHSGRGPRGDSSLHNAQPPTGPAVILSLGAPALSLGVSPVLAPSEAPVSEGPKMPCGGQEGRCVGRVSSAVLRGGPFQHSTAQSSHLASPTFLSPSLLSVTSVPVARPVPSGCQNRAKRSGLQARLSLSLQYWRRLR